TRSDLREARPFSFPAVSTAVTAITLIRVFLAFLTSFGHAYRDRRHVSCLRISRYFRDAHKPPHPWTHLLSPSRIRLRSTGFVFRDHLHTPATLHFRRHNRRSHALQSIRGNRSSGMVAYANH